MTEHRIRMFGTSFNRRRHRKISGIGMLERNKPGIGWKISGIGLLNRFEYLSRQVFGLAALKGYLLILDSTCSPTFFNAQKKTRPFF